MLAHKTFLKKTRRGKILKVVREHYLRQDLHCGWKACAHCAVAAPSEASVEAPLNTPLTPPEVSPCEAVASPHLLILDTNVVLDQIDVLESGHLADVVLLQTVVQEVRHRSSPIYKRLQDLLAQSQRRFYFFVNEHHADTFVARRPGETPNDHNDRAIRRAALWYRQHLGWAVVLLTQDADNRQKAQAQGLIALSVETYVRGLVDQPELADKLAVRAEQAHDLTRPALFPEHWAPAAINRGVKNGQLLVGVFYLSRTNYTQASINVEGRDQPVLIQGLAHQNRALDGDRVAVELLPAPEWRAESEVVLEDDGQDPGDTITEDHAVSGSTSRQVQPSGKVVGIVQRKRRQYCGVLLPSPVPQATRHLFVPAEKKIPRVRIETRQVQRLTGQRIIVTIDAWPRHSRYPQGHFVRALGPIGDKATENEVLLLEHDIPHSKFSEAVLACLPELPWVITPQDESERVDCRHLDICSVDPPGCTDIDDALHCIQLPNGNFQVGVHIADVSHFIRPNTPIDLEAASRSTTVYLTDRRIDMVPGLLSSNLCSLRGGVERFAFSCVWEMDPEARIIQTKFHKSIIKSRAALTYEQAQNRIDDPSDETSVTQSLRQLMSLSKILKQRRLDQGALVLASSEVRFTVDSETADPIDVQVKQMRDTNSMVEEFMLAANISSAKRIFQEFPDCAMLRRHPAPPPSNFDPLVKAGKRQGYEIKVDSGKALADSLNAATDGKNAYFNTMLRMIATRCMMQAVYFASGTIEEPLFQHYGLACPIYTHFTSPIRRYADVIVHRLLAASIGADSTYPALLDKKSTQNIANNINYRHRMAQYASRASVNLHTHMFFRNKKRDEIGYVLFVRQNAIQVLIPKYGLEGTLYLRSDTDKSIAFHFDEDEPSQSCGDVTIRLFQKLRVQLTLDSSNVQHEKLVLRLVEPHIPGFSVEAISDDETSMEEEAPLAGSTPSSKIEANAKPTRKRSSPQNSKATPKAKKGKKS
ncbi:hypothetical protein TCAL_13903 [Tigriopus californicus]|uniref:Protein DIS3 homolog n=1 Tax=Tigriopus californicus TaxID=6832 RepID=A0A553N7Y2_TIGCA|nr:exosome complex exonuclease RRP44-like [Tigriopus californicus]TRY61520.1 hypothetical protein TCAL_13903 [Tigriopus californicus]|eukprot:TCALIF_13903-PA protein Name:"Similar to DIS3 Exosome complex exonuclease RRP44 (Homo sapiens)" AED:0.03 eAED:0.03 QI:0/-1/0/1/-1/1/1/0/984